MEALQNLFFSFSKPTKQNLPLSQIKYAGGCSQNVSQG
jgi:hypothetical protein